MDPLKITILLSLVAVISLTVCWLDHKNNWQLADWINGRCSNPFTQAQKNTQSLDDKDLLIKRLVERIQVLETIVTEPSYELNKKLNQL
ncbi:MAG: hypothetical protein JKY14_05925 [Paraglaciecola sp.]|nr:hypothetical protein [Paraglaciecola sp.]